MINFNRIFEDKDTKNLRKQIQEAGEYLNKEIDKSIVKQLLLQVLEKGYLPILDYPVRITPHTLPMHYSKQRDHQINIHSPIPKVRLLSKREYEDRPILKDAGEREEQEPRPSFDELLADVKRRVEKLDF